MGLIRFIQTHNRNKELKNMRKLKEQELDILERKEISDVKKESEVNTKEITTTRYEKSEKN